MLPAFAINDCEQERLSALYGIVLLVAPVRSPVQTELGYNENGCRPCFPDLTAGERARK